MVRSKRGGASMLKSANNSAKKLNNLLKDPENMLIAVLLVILIGLVIYYMRMNKGEGYTDYENFSDYEEDYENY